MIRPLLLHNTRDIYTIKYRMASGEGDEQVKAKLGAALANHRRSPASAYLIFVTTITTVGCVTKLSQV